MHRILTLALGLVCLCAAGIAEGQDRVAQATRAADLRGLSQALMVRDAEYRRQAREYARALGIAPRRDLPGGGVLELQRYVPGLGPTFYITNNVGAADTVSTDEVWPGGSAGLNLDGSGMTVGEWDGGAVYAHPDLAGRLLQVDGATVVSGHSTHVAGTLAGSGDGTQPGARGMAFAADLDAYDWNSDTAEMAAAAASGLLISNHSYGIAAGWIYLGNPPPDNWWWIGGADPSDVEDPYFGFYDVESQLWDQIAFDAPYYLIVKAAGNDRSDTGPAPGEEYTVIDQDGNPLFTSTLPRNPDCWPAGYDCLPTNSVAKNVLTVGAVEDLPGGYSPLGGPGQVQMSPFSSWGPSDDGRIKPDVVGNGVFLLSLWPETPFYAVAAGTSMAAPNVTGSLLLVQEHYEDLHGPGQYLRAATLKALAIHTADEAGNAPGPDYAFGWGLLNTESATDLLSNLGSDHVLIEDTLGNGAVNSVPVNVSAAGARLKATLVWADPPGTPVPLSLDPPDLMLVNDLDLRVVNGGTTYFPWVLDPANPAAAATQGNNVRDNVEQVVADDLAPGTYNVQVSHAGTLQNAPQAYSLVISELPPPPTGSDFLIDEDFSGGLPAGWSVDTVQGVPWTINSPVPGDPRLDNNTGGGGNFAIVDNGWVNDTITSLRTPVLDLSANDAAVLRFLSQHSYDTFESFNVDVSTNGGGSWQNVWTFQGFNPFPTQITLDLSALVAGESAVMIRWRFDSEGWLSGDYWQVDSIELETFGGGPPPGDPPDPATAPVPADGAVSVSINADLSWTEGAGATSHDVYFGTSTPLDGSDFQANQLGTSFDPGTLAHSTTYYWRVDEVNSEGFTTGTTWSFTTEAAPPVPPDPASNPLPASGATNVGIDADLSWDAGANADTHDVYFGTANPPGPGQFQGNQPGTSFDPGTLAYSTTYYWRIDEVNADGTTTGSVWSFTTEAAPPVLPGPAGNPSPGDGTANININADLSWTAGSATDSHDVYFGTVNPPGGGQFQGNQPGTSFDPGTLAYSTTYYWRIDEVNADGTTTGSVWSFTTEAAPPPPPADTVHLSDLSGVALPPDKGRWTAQASVAVHDNGHAPEAGVTVSGNWSNGTNGGGSCVTAADGTCSINKNNLKNNVLSVTFTVTAMTKSGFSYAPADNEAPGSVVIGPGAGDQQPVAVNDSYSTGVDEALNGNVMDNDDPGDGPAQVNSHTSPASGLLSLNADGSFSYTPNGGFEGEDSFQYDIVDSDGDLSGMATVTITVADAPPPPPPGARTVSVTAYKVKGVQHVDIAWQNFTAGSVDITRDSTAIATGTANDGAHTDNIGVKGGGVSYVYTVCEAGTSDCASATATF